VADGTINYEYSNATDRLTRTYTGTSSARITDTQYVYDRLGRLTQANDVVPLIMSGITSYTYDASSNLGWTRSDNLVISTYKYDDLNRLTELLYFKDDHYGVTAMPTDNNGVLDAGEPILGRYRYELPPDGKRRAASEVLCRLG
jgi:hypothetical protein